MPEQRLPAGGRPAGSATGKGLPYLADDPEQPEFSPEPPYTPQVPFEPVPAPMPDDGGQGGRRRLKGRGRGPVKQWGTPQPPAPIPGNIHCLTIIGQIEGHLVLPSQNKTTKYEHLIPQLVAIEQSPQVEGLLVVLNTVGGDVEAGLALAEMIASLSKPTVSLVLGGGHSIGVPIAVAADHSFISTTATMTIHPIRLTGLVVGVPQTYEYLDKMQDRVVKFVVGHSRITEARYRELMFRTGELARDIGTVLVGKDAVEEGLIDEVGGLAEAVQVLKGLVEKRKKARERLAARQAPERAAAGAPAPKPAETSAPQPPVPPPPPGYQRPAVPAQPLAPRQPAVPGRPETFAPEPSVSPPSPEYERLAAPAEPPPHRAPAVPGQPVIFVPQRPGSPQFPRETRPPVSPQPETVSPTSVRLQPETGPGAPEPGGQWYVRGTPPEAPSAGGRGAEGGGLRSIPPPPPPPRMPGPLPGIPARRDRPGPPQGPVLPGDRGAATPASREPVPPAPPPG